MTNVIARMTRGNRPLRWVFAGDSVTQGARHTGFERDYVQLFEEHIRWNQQRRRDHVICTAVSGSTVSDIAHDLSWAVLQYRPDVVSLMLGLNDCAIDGAPVDTFKATYGAVVDSIERDGARVILHTPNRILFVADQPERQAQLPSFVTAIRELAQEKGVPLIDHYSAWAIAEQTGQLEEWINEDCHPNGAGHRILCQTFLATLGLAQESVR